MSPTTTQLANGAPADELEKAALITQLVCSAVNLDYSARRLQALRSFSGNAKRRLNLLTAASDSFVAEAIKTFDFADGDSINLLSDVLCQVEKLLLQCKPNQIEECLHLLNGFNETNRVAWLAESEPQ